MKVCVQVYEFASTGELFLAESKHDAVQMWRVGTRAIGLERGEPRELCDPLEVVEGLTVQQWQRIGQRGLIERRRAGP